MFAPSGRRDLCEEREPHGAGQAGCCLGTFNVRIGVAFERQLRATGQRRAFSDFI